MKALKIAMLVSFVSITPQAFAGLHVRSFDFETSGEGWFFAGNAGLDYNAGLAHKGLGNAWVRNTTGWNAINQWIYTGPRSECVIQAWIRSSASLTNGSMIVRNDEAAVGHGDIIQGVDIVGTGPQNPDHANYNLYKFHFSSGANSRVLFHIGFWGNGLDAWMQIDDVAMSCFTPE